jgi:hypothetical protein
VIVHVPTLTSVTVVPVTVQTPVVEDAKPTARPESDDAVTLRVPAVTATSPGWANVIVCACRLPAVPADQPVSAVPSALTVTVGTTPGEAPIVVPAIVANTWFVYEPEVSGTYIV